MEELDGSLCIAVKGLVAHCYKTLAFLEGEDLSKPETWFEVTPTKAPFIAFKLKDDVEIYKTLMETYPKFIMHLVVCLKDTPLTLKKLMKMKGRAKTLKSKAKPEIMKLGAMAKIGFIKKFATNM